MSADFYVYAMFLHGRPVYIGKGCGRRWQDRRRRSAAIKALIAEHGELPTVKVRENLTEAEAFETEIAFIAAIGRRPHDGPLVNVTTGGGGAPGHVKSDETRAKIGEAMKGRVHNRGRKHTAEARAKMSAAMKGKQNCLGRKLSPETRAKMDAGKIGKPKSVEHRAKLSAACSGWKMSPATIAKREATKARNRAMKPIMKQAA